MFPLASGGASPYSYASEVTVASKPSAKVEERFEEPTGAPAEPPRGWALGGLGAGLLLLALGALQLALGGGPLVIAAFVVGGAAVVVALLALRGGSAPPRRALLLRGREIFLDEAQGREPRPLARFPEPFGVTLLANRARSRLAMALTSADSTFYVGATIPEAERSRCRGLLTQAFTVASDERALEPAGPDGLPLMLSGDAFVRLHEALLRLEPSSSGRVFLTDVRGEPVRLDGARLTVGHSALDLSASLDWRGMLFREAEHGGLAIYQGTYVRQGATELVFVSLMPALAAPSDPGDVLSTREPSIERAVQRDLALLQESTEEPPPTELRVAIERVFMLPIRAALSASPTAAPQRSSRPTPPRPTA